MAPPIIRNGWDSPKGSGLADGAQNSISTFLGKRSIWLKFGAPSKYSNSHACQLDDGLGISPHILLGQESFMIS